LDIESLSSAPCGGVWIVKKVAPDLILILVADGNVIDVRSGVSVD
jgi:hypothetical protein